MSTQKPDLSQNISASEICVARLSIEYAPSATSLRSEHVNFPKVSRFYPDAFYA